VYCTPATTGNPEIPSGVFTLMSPPAAATTRSEREPSRYAAALDVNVQFALIAHPSTYTSIVDCSRSRRFVPQIGT